MSRMIAVRDLKVGMILEDGNEISAIRETPFGNFEVRFIQGGNGFQRSLKADMQFEVEKREVQS